MTIKTIAAARMSKISVLARQEGMPTSLRTIGQATEPTSAKTSATDAVFSKKLTIRLSVVRPFPRSFVTPDGEDILTDGRWRR